MFPRARHVALEFKAQGATVVMGGFHISGSITMLHDGNGDSNIPCPRVMPPECAELMERGVILFHGEAEGIWHEVLGDIVRGEAKPLYRGGRPALVTAPLPEYPPHYFKVSSAGCIRSTPDAAAPSPVASARSLTSKGTIRATGAWKQSRTVCDARAAKRKSPFSSSRTTILRETLIGRTSSKGSCDCGWKGLSSASWSKRILWPGKFPVSSNFLPRPAATRSSWAWKPSGRKP